MHSTPESDKLIREAIHSSSTLEDLAQKLKPDFWEISPDWLRYNLNALWLNVTVFPKMSLIPQPEPIDDLPSTTLVKEGIEYRIHGIVHGLDKSKDKSLVPSTKLKNVVRAAAERYNKPLEMESFVCEEGFTEVFGLPNGHEMFDVTVTNTYETLSMAIKNKSMRWYNLFRRSFSGRISHFLSQDSLIKESNKAFIALAISDPSYLPVVRAALKAADIPIELRVSANLRKWSLDSVDYISDATSLERSAYMSCFMQMYARHHGLRKLHAIVGHDHEDEIEYFIKNPSALPVDYKSVIEPPKATGWRPLPYINPVQFIVYHPGIASIFLYFGFNISRDSLNLNPAGAFAVSSLLFAISAIIGSIPTYVSQKKKEKKMLENFRDNLGVATQYAGKTFNP